MTFKNCYSGLIEKNDKALTAMTQRFFIPKINIYRNTASLREKANKRFDKIEIMLAGI